MHFAQGVHHVDPGSERRVKNSDQEEEGKVKDDDPSYVPDPDEISGCDNNDDQNDYDTDDLYE